MNKEAGNVISETFSGDETKLDTIMKRIAVKPSTITKMRKISSLFNDEIGIDLKDADLISAFLELSFESFLRSGEIEKRIKSLTGDL